MADFALRNNISKISSQSILVIEAGLVIDQKWFDEDIDIVLSNNLRIAPIIIDFAFSIPTIVEYTLGGDATGTYVQFNDGNPVTGGQSRFIRVTNGDKLNIRAQLAGDLIRAVVGEP